MNQFTKILVVSKQAIQISPEVSVEVGDVGIVKSEYNKTSEVFFIRIWQAIRVNNDSFKVFDVNRTGDSFSYKICNICHKLLPTDQFAKNQNAKNNRSVRRPSCSNCRKILEGMNIKPKMRGTWTKTKPHITPFECPICNKRTIAGITSKVVLDHNHRSGKPRAWICDSCNTGIGRFQDDIAILQRAIKFLE